MNPLLFLLLITPAGLTVPQEHVLPVFGCGTGCRVETEQLSLPEEMPDGWIKVKVRQRPGSPDATGALPHSSALLNLLRAEQVHQFRNFGYLPTALGRSLPPARAQTEAMLGSRMSSTEKGSLLDTRNIRRFMEIPSCGGRSYAHWKQKKESALSRSNSSPSEIFLTKRNETTSIGITSNQRSSNDI